MQALVAASEKVRALLKPIAKYNLRLEQLVKDWLSPTDGRKADGKIPRRFLSLYLQSLPWD
jgi:hypothetical protein